MNANKCIKILIVDDVGHWRRFYQEGIEELIDNNNLKSIFSNFMVAEDGEEALKIIMSNIDINLVVTDLFMGPNCKNNSTPDDDDVPFGGIWLIEQINKLKDRMIKVILVSNKDDANKHVKKLLIRKNYKYSFALKDEKKDLQGKSFQLISELLLDFNLNKTTGDIEEDTQALKSVIEKVSNVAATDCTDMITDQADKKAGEIVGKSKALKAVIDLAFKVAATDSTVLITGKTGTGKELIAEFIHKNSKRKDKPFIAVNCAGIPETILESVLFGHKRGAFTGAESVKRGKFEMAQGGTLFLDEIGGATFTTQKKLLRVLEDNKFEVLGSDEPTSSDVRIITATSGIISDEVMLEDFYFRIAVIHISVPPLSDRPDDIDMLVDHFIEKYTNILSITEPIKEQEIVKLKNECKTINWIGNVRQLKHAIERYCICRDLSELGLNLYHKSVSSMQVHANPVSSNNGQQTLKDIADYINNIQLPRKLGATVEGEMIILENAYIDLVKKIFGEAYDLCGSIKKSLDFLVGEDIGDIQRFDQ